MKNSNLFCYIASNRKSMIYSKSLWISSYAFSISMSTFSVFMKLDHNIRKDILCCHPFCHPAMVGRDGRIENSLTTNVFKMVSPRPNQTQIKVQLVYWSRHYNIQKRSNNRFILKHMKFNYRDYLEN